MNDGSRTASCLGQFSARTFYAGKQLGGKSDRGKRVINDVDEASDGHYQTCFMFAYLMKLHNELSPESCNPMIC